MSVWFVTPFFHLLREILSAPVFDNHNRAKAEYHTSLKIFHALIGNPWLINQSIR